MRALTVLLLCACNDVPDTIEGRVVDVWGQPVEGATVVVVGGAEQQVTGPDGRYALPRVDGKIVVKTGRKGYVQDQRELEVLAGEKVEGPLFELFPKPEEAGFYAVGTTGYKKLEPRPAKLVGNALKQFVGLPDPGEVVLETVRPRILYHNDKIRHDQIVRLGLQLRHLRWVGEEVVPGLQGDTPIPVNLYVDDGGAAMDLVPLGSRSDYLILPKQDLELGVYALQTQGLLTSQVDDGAFDTLPEEMRIAFPLTLK